MYPDSSIVPVASAASIQFDKKVNVDKDSTTVPVRLVDAKHIEYTRSLETWFDLSLLYEGGFALKAALTRLLKKRPKEDEDIFAARLQRATYQNILGTAIGWYDSAMFVTPPQISLLKKSSKKGDSAKTTSTDEFYTKFLDNCTNNGVSFIDLLKKLFTYTLVYGKAWTLIDTPVRPEQDIDTLQQEKDLGLFNPHILLYSPIEVINWDVDSNGNILWAVLKNVKVNRPFLSTEGEIIETWYYYDKEMCRKYESIKKESEKLAIGGDEYGNRVATLISTTKHVLYDEKRVPLQLHQLTEGQWLANRAYLVLIDHLNQDNTLAWSLFMSNLAIPVVIGDVDPTNMTSSEAGYYHFPAGTTYQWTEPAGTSFQHSDRRLSSLREESFRCMHLQAQGRSMHATPAMQSGESKLQDMKPAKDVLASMGSDIRTIAQNILKDVVCAHKDSETEPDVRGLNFEEEMTTEEVFAATSVLGMKIPSRSLEKSIQKRVAKKWVPDANRSEIETIFKEIEDGPTMKEQLEEEQEFQVELAGKALKANMANKAGAGNMPPGRGGSQPSPKTKK